MPVRLDPFQNIVGVNWGGRLAAICELAFDFEGLGLNPWMINVVVNAPESLGPIGGLADGDSVTGLTEYIDGEFYTVHSFIRRDGFDNDPRFPGFRGVWVRPLEISGGFPEVVELRIFGRSTDSSLPTVAVVYGTFGFGLELFQPGQFVGRRLEGLLWEHWPIQIPLPNEYETTVVRATRERRFERWGNRAFIRTIDGLGLVADFGTLRLNFRTGGHELLPPDLTPETPDPVYT